MFILTEPKSKKFNIGKTLDNLYKYDIINSWVIGTKDLGYTDLSIFLRNTDMNKADRFLYLYYLSQEVYHNLFIEMEKWWLQKLNEFIYINNITEKDYISHSYDEIILNKKVQTLQLNQIQFKETSYGKN